jgi:hypothetical protein
MTFIELLDLLISRASLNEVEMRDARKLLSELEALNAFGVVLGKTATQAHECKPAGWPHQGTCMYCKRSLNV